MKTKALTILAVLVVILPCVALAGGSTNYTCNTKYPVVLAHGMAASAQILGIVDYWWGIEDALEDEGATVFTTAVNAMGGTVDKAKDFNRQVLEICAVTGKAKVNIIGHSHGTIYSRYAISNLGLAGKVRSWTSCNGPHRGSALADLIANDVPDVLESLASNVLDFLYTWVMGDTDPDFNQNIVDLTKSYMTNVFNPNCPNISGIYYQSYTTKAKIGCPSVVLEPLWLIMLAMGEGDNDGLVSVTSAKWGTFRGTEGGAWYSPGVDHINAVGHLFGLTPGFDAPAYYVNIVKDLKNKGY